MLKINTKFIEHDYRHHVKMSPLWIQLRFLFINKTIVVFAKDYMTV